MYYYEIDKDKLRSLIEEEVSKAADEAYSEGGQSLYDSIILTDRDFGAVDRFIGDAINAFVTAAYSIARFSSITDEDTGAKTERIELNIPDFDASLWDAAQAELDRYICLWSSAALFNQRYAIKYPEYSERAKTALAKSISLLKTRGISTKPPVENDSEHVYITIDDSNTHITNLLNDGKVVILSYSAHLYMPLDFCDDSNEVYIFGCLKEDGSYIGYKFDADGTTAINHTFAKISGKSPGKICMFDALGNIVSSGQQASDIIVDPFPASDEYPEGGGHGMFLYKSMYDGYKWKAASKTFTGRAELSSEDLSGEFYNVKIDNFDHWGIPDYLNEGTDISVNLSLYNNDTLIDSVRLHLSDFSSDYDRANISFVCVHYNQENRRVKIVTLRYLYNEPEENYGSFYGYAVEVQPAEFGKGLSTNNYTNEDRAQVEKAKAVIPATSNKDNQLADKNFVNSSIQTATAFFRGNFEDWANVPEYGDGYPGYGGNPDMSFPDTNDYMVVRDASGYAPEWKETGRYEEGNYVLYQGIMYKCKAEHNASWEDRPSENDGLWEQVESNPNYEGTWRFKYVGVLGYFQKDNWKPEYLINKFPLTTEQVAAVISGITESDVTRLRGLDEVFYAEYNVATFDEVKSAFENNKLVWTKYGNAVYILSYFSSSERVVFARVGDSNSSSATVLDKNEGWQGLAYFYAADYTIKNRVEKLETLIYAAL